MSSISGIESGSSSSFVFELQKRKEDNRSKDFETLSDALESGDVEAAQAALEVIQQKISNAQNAESGQGGGEDSELKSSITNDLKAIADALESGDTDAATEAFNTLKSDMREMDKSRRMQGPPPPPPPQEEESDDEEESSDSAALELIEGATSGSSASSTDTTLSTLIAYLSNGDANTEEQTGSRYKSQA